MRKVVDKPTTCRLTLKVMSECIVNVPTNSKGLGLLDRAEISPGVFLAASLNRGDNGVCVRPAL